SSAARDRVSGASAIALRCAAGLRKLVEDAGEVGKDELADFAISLTRAQPNMAPLWNLANDLLLSDGSLSAVVEICRRTEMHHAHASRAVGRFVSSELAGKTVVTNSSSSAVFDALVSAKRMGSVTALIPESRPMLEGLAMAKELVRRGVPVILFGDSSLSRAVRLADVAAVGSDAVTGSHVLGKVGIVNLALSSREYGLRCIVCADTSKFFPIRLQEEQRPGYEILRHPPRGMDIDNVYFEEARIGLFSEIFTERARISPTEAKRLVRRMRIAPELAPTSSRARSCRAHAPRPS
ncbi:MAG: hypothetical protein QXT42_06465, partial [Thermoplasmata archaeon]